MIIIITTTVTQIKLCESAEEHPPKHVVGCRGSDSRILIPMKHFGQSDNHWGQLDETNSHIRVFW